METTWIMRVYVFINLVLVCASDVAFRFKYIVSDWRKCDTGNHEFRMFRNIPIQKCLLECRIRKRCKAVKFLTIRRECGLLETDVSMATGYNTRPCFYIRMTDVEDVSPLPSICQTCSIKQSCDIQKDTCVIREVCEDGWNQFEKSCYFFSPNLRIFAEAKDYCNVRRSHLVHIETAAENEHILDLIKGKNAYAWWLGMTDKQVEGEWRYTKTNSVVEFLPWGPEEPNLGIEENCAAIFNNLWVDIGCHYKSSTICEKGTPDQVYFENLPPSNPMQSDDTKKWSQHRV